MEERFKFLSPLLFEVVILTYCFIFRTFLFLQIPTHPENHSIPLNRRISKYIYSGSLRGNGDETQESWKPLLNTILALRGSSECFAQLGMGWILFFSGGVTTYLIVLPVSRKYHYLSSSSNLYNTRQTPACFHSAS